MKTINLIESFSDYYDKLEREFINNEDEKNSRNYKYKLQEDYTDTLRKVNNNVELAIDKIGAPVLTSALSSVFGTLGLTVGGLPGAILGGVVGVGVALAGKKINKLFNEIIDNVVKRRNDKFEKKFTDKIQQLENKYGKKLNDKQKAFIRLQMIDDKEIQKDYEISKLIKEINELDGVDIEKLIELINKKININLDENKNNLKESYKEKDLLKILEWFDDSYN